MIKFNDDNIFVGYLKELLSSIQIPTIKIYRKDSECIKNTLYLKDNYIVKCDSEQIINFVNKVDEDTLIESIEEKITPPTFKPIQYFKFNKGYNNFTSSFNNTNLIYDKETHIYLGNYLRYLRDYNHLDLMSMYNCFTDETPKNLNIKVNTQMKNESDNFIYSDFNSEQANYKYYIIPVKFFEDYMISIDSTLPLELCCCFYGKRYYNLGVNDSLSSLTYKKISSSIFDKPFKYTLLNELKDSLNALQNKYFSLEDYINYEKDLKLVIKLPKDNLSSIVVIEGNHNIYNEKYFEGTYSKNNIYRTDSGHENEILSSTDSFDSNCLNQKYVNMIVNFKNSLDSFNNMENIKFPTKSQLTFFNSGNNIPFSNRLLEYLVDNVVTNNEDISDNIKRIQYNLLNKHETNIKFKKLNEEIIKQENESGKILPKNSLYKGALNTLPSKLGIWDDTYKACLYEVAKQKNLHENEFDILCYMDKDVEKALGSEYDIYKEE